MNKIYDVCIFGAGVVGCCIASDLTRSGYSVCLLEKNNDVATGASKANSGLIHAGFDAKPNTMKALLNVQGNSMYPSVCARLGLPIKKCGAVVVGNDINVVNELYNRGIQNKVKNLYVLNREQLLSILPNLQDNISVGLYAKNAYIVSPYLLTICLAEESIVNGADVLLNFDANKITNKKDYYQIDSKNNSVCAKYIINSAGVGVNQISKLLKDKQYNIEFRRGEYFVLDNDQIHTTPLTVFPLPSKTSKGVLITPTIDGNILVGPTSYISDNSVPTTLDGLNEIRQKSNALLKNVNLKKSIRQFSGVRTIVGDDFVIEKSTKNPRVLTIAGICSPGLSSAPAISKFAIEKLGLDFNPTKKTKQIQPYFLSKDLNKTQKNELISKNPKYGKIVCKCENITEGDILFALNRPLKINSIDGVKRRVRAGMGRCQGGFCKVPVAEIIAKTRKIPLEDVVKENVGSYLFISDIRGGRKNA